MELLHQISKRSTFPFLCVQRSVENPSAVPVSKQTAAHWDAHPEHNGWGEQCVYVCVLTLAHVCSWDPDRTVDGCMLLLSLSCGPCCTSSCPRCSIPTTSLTSGSPRTSRATPKTSRPSTRVSRTPQLRGNNVPLCCLFKSPYPSPRLPSPHLLPDHP